MPGILERGGGATTGPATFHEDGTRVSESKTAALRPFRFLKAVREKGPLVHNITNYVVMNSTANALLAAGASPAMVHAVEEVEEFTSISSALVVNIGTLSAPWVQAMHLAARQAADSSIPWVLDPVGVGATRFRTETAASLMAHRPTVVRGNASEIMVVAGAVGSAGKGVDSTQDSHSAVDPARALALESGSIVAMTGAVDYVTDGARTVAIRNGDPMMGRVTGLGCTASALVGAFLAAGDDAFNATVAALATLGVAGELAAAVSPGPGSLQLHILDLLHTMDEDVLDGRASVSVVS